MLEGVSVSELLLSVIVFALALLGMSLGVIFSNRSIRGSCGGSAKMGGEHHHAMCETCSSNPAPDCTVPTEGACRHRGEAGGAARTSR
jgi:hypothetical protein